MTPRRPERGPAATPALAALQRAGAPHTVHAYPHDALTVAAGLGYGMEAAAALDVDPHRVFKTLVVTTSAGVPGWGVGIVPVTAQLDLSALAAALGVKRVTMADPTTAERVTGYVVGGISPLGQRRSLPTVLDVTATDHATIFVSAGRRGLDAEVAAADLVRLTGAIVRDIATSN